MSSSLHTILDEMPAAEAPIVKFTPVNGYTTFRAEYAFEDGDIVFHFFVSDEIHYLPKKEVLQYWTESFPEALEQIAPAIFKDKGRLQATYISDYGLNSWWLRAGGFASVVDPTALCEKFFDALDSCLDAEKNT